MLKQDQTNITVQTSGIGAYEITRTVADFIDQTRIRNGLINLLVQHTSASLTIQENADPDVQVDLLNALDRLAPEANHYRHSAEGPDDMPAHIKSALTSTSLAVPVQNGRLALGTWQGIYLLEHRRHGHHRRIACHLLGE